MLSLTVENMLPIVVLDVNVVALISNRFLDLEGRLLSLIFAKLLLLPVLDRHFGNYVAKRWYRTLA